MVKIRSTIALCLVAIVLVFLGPSSESAAQDCYTSAISSPTPFLGNNGEVFRLTDGSLWEVKYEYEYLYVYYPEVVICPSRGKLMISGRSLNVQLIARGRAAPQTGPPATATSPSLIESRIDGEFKGWEGETIFKLANGQIWQQASYAYTYSYAYSPAVIIFRTASGYQMQVEGVSGRIAVRRLK